MDVFSQVAIGILTAMVIVGVVPLVAGLWQYFLVGVHGVRNDLMLTGDYAPRTAVIIPAWNEEAVIGRTVDRLTDLEYPAGRIRIYVVDDASTDATPQILTTKQAEYPEQVFPLRREKGGEGKAHTLNHGLSIVLADDWADAILIIDADVIFERDALRRMGRHLADPQVGSVTAYIKEGSRPANYLKRFISFEYITAQAAGRRAQNVVGAMVCLAGGAQLHSRSSLDGIGGQIDTSTLAEDTITTFRTQLIDFRAVFDGNAVVWAEEPGDINGLWMQRTRWARGNIQVHHRFRWVWLRPKQAGRMGGISVALFWFSALLMPVFMIASTIGLIALLLIDYGFSLDVFRVFWMINAFTYVVVTAYSLMIDPQTARKAWLQGLLFPGLVSLMIILGTSFPPLFQSLTTVLAEGLGLTINQNMKEAVLLFVYAWLSLSMVVAWLAKAVEQTWLGFLSPSLIYLAGFGPLLSAITFAAYIKEWRGAEAKWEKTQKSGQVAMDPR